MGKIYYSNHNDILVIRTKKKVIKINKTKATEFWKKVGAVALAGAVLGLYIAYANYSDKKLMGTAIMNDAYVRENRGAISQEGYVEFATEYADEFQQYLDSKDGDYEALDADEFYEEYVRKEVVDATLPNVR